MQEADPVVFILVLSVCQGSKGEKGEIGLPGQRGLPGLPGSPVRNTHAPHSHTHTPSLCVPVWILVSVWDQMKISGIC